MPECDDWWGMCVGYPGRADKAAFRAFVKSKQANTGMFQSPIPTVTVADVREASALRERVVDFAVATQGWTQRPSTSGSRRPSDAGATREPATT